MIEFSLFICVAIIVLMLLCYVFINFKPHVEYMNTSEQPIIRTDTLSFYQDTVQSRRVITIGKYLQAVVLESYGATPQSNIKLGGGMTISLKEFVHQCNGKPIEISFGKNAIAEKRIWNVIVKCFDFSESQFTSQTSPFKIRVSMLSNNRSLSENIYKFIATRESNALSIDDLPKDKLEYFVPFYRFELFGNMRTLVLDDIIYSHSTLFQESFQRIYSMEQRDSQSNLFYSRFFKFYERVLKQIEKTEGGAPTKLLATGDLKRAIELIKLNQLKLKANLAIKEKEINIPYANIQIINKTILQYNHELIKLDDDLKILTAGIEEFKQSTQLQNASININHPVAMEVISSYKDMYRKLKIITSLNVSLKIGDMIKLTNQNDKSLNGNYYVESSLPHIVIENIPSLSFFATFKIIKVHKDDVDKLFYNDNKKTIIATSEQLFPFDMVWFNDLNERGHLVNVKNTKTIAIIHKGIHETIRKNEHICVGNMNILDQEVCKSKGFDWDRMCTSDFDCPFFNKQNKRGGCNSNGYCEMPIGAKQVAFTKFSNVKGIYCHGCSQETSPHCCTVSDESGWPAFHGDSRPVIESFINGDKLLLYLRSKSSQFDVNMDLWRQITPELYLVELAAKTILGVEYAGELYRAYPIENKFFKAYQPITKDIFFSSIVILKGGTVISYDTLYEPISNEMKFTNTLILGTVQIGAIEFQSYTDVIQSLPSLSFS